MTSRDGYQWTSASGLIKGVPSIGVVQPSSNLRDTAGRDYDVIVIGHRTLLLEARDRIGGRSWSSNIDGYAYEMGGTWVSWRQPHVWREISRYGLRKELEISPNETIGKNYSTLVTSEHGRRNMSHHEEELLMQSALSKLCNVDGNEGRSTIPFPHDEFHVPDAKKWDTISLAERLDQIDHLLSPDERAVAKEWVLATSGGTPENSSFYEWLHWWALCSFSYSGWVEDYIKYKFRAGQSTFAIKFFREALATGSLSYAFNIPISWITDDKHGVSVTSKNGEVYRASKVICTIPLNVLKMISFSPALTPAKAEAVSIGHINNMAKVHCEAKGLDLRSWSGLNSDHNPLTFAFGDGVTPAGNAHIVAFGPSEHQLHPERDIEVTKQAVKNLTDLKIERLVFHNWADDEYAQGAWFFSKPGFITKYLEALRAPQGNIHFANADWAVGWRSFIDGAIEEGTRAVVEVTAALTGKARL